METKSIEAQLSELRQSIKNLKLICGASLIALASTIVLHFYFADTHHNEIDKTDKLQYDMIMGDGEIMDEIIDAIVELRNDQKHGSAKLRSK